MQDGRASARPGSAKKVAELAAGARIGRYVVLDSVGSGAMGVVYGAYDPELDRKIAVKLLKPGHGNKETARERLLREAKAMAQLSHPNVVAVHDVGVFEGQVFLAMEFLNAGTLKRWVGEKTHTWREILAVFAAAGRGLAAAHAAGIVHRDFKPDNVLLDREERPRVVDFGIARRAVGKSDEPSADDDAADSDPGAATASEAAAARLRDSSGNQRPLLTLTKTGALVGTPAYMSPEQFMGERGDDKSDQFSFCVALYEALYGERPFAGEDVLAISVNVTEGQIRPLPKDRGVPSWIRRVLIRGLATNPAARWPSMGELIAALEDDPALKMRRRALAVGATVVLLAAALWARHIATSRRLETEREIGKYVDAAATRIAAARAKDAEAKELRRNAFARFDAMDRDHGEALWRATRVRVPEIDRDYDDAGRDLEAAFTLDQTHAELRRRLAEIRYEQLLFARDFRLEAKAQVLEERLRAADLDGSKRDALKATGMVMLRTTPAAQTVTLERYEPDPVSGRRVPKMMPGSYLSGPIVLPQGSYRFTIRGPGLADVYFPFEVERGEHLTFDLALPAARDVPSGFAYVPPGSFWFGDGDEQLRSQFLGAVPIHRRSTGAYAIAQHETTYAEWIAFLEALPGGERSRYAPNVSATTRGSLRLRETGGSWELTFQPTSRRYTAAAGELVSYAGRRTLAQQDWRQFPVSGVSPRDAQRYISWLRGSRRIPGARLCTELEWERAARGADERIFPSGDEIGPDEANFDQTYGRVDSAYGPDVVGAHPASRSPFGVDDLMGNVFELTESVLNRDELVIRGGGYYFAAINGRSTNREPVSPAFRDPIVGIRLCASVQGENDAATE